MANFTTSGQLPAVEAAIYTAPAANTAVKTIILANSSASTITEAAILKIGTLEIGAFSISPGVTIEFSPSFPIVLAAGEAINAVTTTAATVSFFVSGVTE